MKTTKINIISGFLGSGKTTFIKKIINESPDFSKTVIIENEFGEVSIDGNLLSIDGINVREINAGCICCSVSDSFSKTILDIKEKINPDRIIIEPSGVGKLSEIIKICDENSDIFKINKIITILDATKYFMYLTNFGDFYVDQIKNSTIILFSRLKKASESGINVNEIESSVREINSSLKIINREWNEIHSVDLLDEFDLFRSFNMKNDHTCSHESCNCNSHVHSSDDFTSITINVKTQFTEEELLSILQRFNNSPFGQIIRAKGSVRNTDNTVLNFDFVPDEINIDMVKKSGNENYVVVIGKKLFTENIKNLFI